MGGVGGELVEVVGLGRQPVAHQRFHALVGVQLQGLLEVAPGVLAARRLHRYRRPLARGEFRFPYAGQRQHPVARVGAPGADGLAGRRQLGLLHQPLQRRAPGAHRGLQQQAPVGLEGRQPVAPLEEAAAPLVGPGQRRPVAVAVLHQVGGVQGEGLGLLGREPAQAGAGPGQVDQAQPVPGRPLQRLALRQEGQQGAAIAALVPLQPLAPGDGGVVVQAQQAGSIEVPALAIALGGKPQQGPQQVVAVAHLPGLIEPLAKARPVLLTRRQRQHRGEAGPQPPGPGAASLGPRRLGAVMHRQPLPQALPGDAVALVLQHRERLAGLQETVVAMDPALGAAGMAQRLQPGVQVAVVGGDLAGQPVPPGARLFQGQPAGGAGQGGQLQCPQQAGRVGPRATLAQSLQQPPAQLATIGYRQGHEAVAGLLRLHAERVGVEGPVAEYQLLGPPGVEGIDQGAPRVSVAGSRGRRRFFGAIV